MKTFGYAETIETAISVLCKQISKEKKNAWEESSEEDLWHELVACILGSQVSYESAMGTVWYLKKNGYLSLKNFERIGQYEEKLFSILNASVFRTEKEKRTYKYRYPRTKANYIRRTGELIYCKGKTIKTILRLSDSAKNARINIVKSSVGIGPKQASLFLRNIGYSDDLAILDAHILEFMYLFGLIGTEISSVSTLRLYEQLEQNLIEYADNFREKISHLDKAIWVTMRVWKKERRDEYSNFSIGWS